VADNHRSTRQADQHQGLTSGKNAFLYQKPRSMR
jgi:hypothetical protein